jgi:hypothetical protein
MVRAHQPRLIRSGHRNSPGGWPIAVQMSAYDPKRTSRLAHRMSAFWGSKADIKVSRPDVPWIAQLIQLPTVGDP